MISELRLYEALLLLATRDQKGGFGHAPALGPALAGAILLELIRAGRIRTDRVKRSNLVRVSDQRLTGQPVLDEWLEQMRSARKDATASTWMARIAGKRKLVDGIADRLWHAGLLRREERSFLLFDYQVFVPGYPKVKQDLVDRLGELIRADHRLDAYDSALVALASKSGVLPAYFSRRELRQRRKRIRELVDAQPIAGDFVSAAAAVGTVTFVALNAVAAPLTADVLLRVR